MVLLPLGVGGGEVLPHLLPDDGASRPGHQEEVPLVQRYIRLPLCQHGQDQGIYVIKVQYET